LILTIVGQKALKDWVEHRMNYPHNITAVQRIKNVLKVGNMTKVIQIYLYIVHFFYRLMTKTVIFFVLIASLALLTATVLSAILVQQTEAAPKEGPLGTKKECRQTVIASGETNQNASFTCNSFTYN